jgi:hypothetical protein
MLVALSNHPYEDSSAMKLFLMIYLLCTSVKFKKYCHKNKSNYYFDEDHAK